MSTTVDQRVVEMRFDNKHFESNVATTMTTLDKLKHALHLDGASKGLENINSAANKVNMSGLANGVETVRAKFSALEIMGVTALANITNSAVNAGKRIVSALTIDPVKTGFSEYEMKMDSIKTIVNSTGRDLKDVNKLLEELNEYSDQTIYSFKDMTQNIGKFTNAGVGLEDAVLAIKGISNEAAVSGASAAEASRAMYNFSQALSAGYVKLIDWKSIENANMATKEFKQQLIDTAVELGVVTKQGDMYTTSTGKSFNATKNFNDTLQEQWMTTDVLIKTLGKYADATTDIGKKAFAAAQEVTKMTQMWDVLKETAQSGWAKTWEHIFGDLDSAKKIFTPLTNFFSNIINAMSDARNRVLDIAFNFSKFWDGITSKMGNVKKVVDGVENFADKLKYFQDVVNKVWRGDYNNRGDNPDRKDLLEAAGYNYDVVQDLVNKGYQYKLTVDDIKASHEKFGLTLTTTTEETEELTTKLEELDETTLKNMGLTEDEIELYKALAKEAKRTGKSIKEIADTMSKNNGREVLIDSFKNFGKVIVDTVNIMKTSLAEIFEIPTVSDMAVRLHGMIMSLHKFSESIQLIDKKTGELNETGKKFNSIFKGIFAAIDIALTIIKGPAKLAFNILKELLSFFGVNVLDILANVGEGLVSFRDIVDKVIDTITKFIVENVGKWIEKFKETEIFKTVASWFSDASEKISDGLDNVSKKFANFSDSGVGKTFEIIGGFISNIAKSISNSKVVTFAIDGIRSAFDKLKTFFAGFKLPELNIDNLSTFFQNVVKIGENIENTGKSGMSGALSGFGQHMKDNVISWNWQVFKEKALEKFVKFFLTFGDKIKKAFEKCKEITDTILKFLFGTEDVNLPMIIDTVTKFLWIITLIKTIQLLDTIVSPFDNIANALDNFASSLKWDAIAGAFKSLAIALGVFTICIVILTQMDTKAAWNAAGMLMALMVVMGAVVTAMGLVAGKAKNGLNTAGATLSLIMLVGSIAILIYALKEIDGLTLKDPTKTIFTLIGILTGLTIAVRAISKAGGASFRSVASILTLVGALKLILEVIEDYDEFDWMGKDRAIGRMVEMMLALSIAIRIMAGGVKAGASASGVALALFAMVISLKVIISAIKEFAAMDNNDIIKGGIVVATVLSILTGMMAVANLTNKGTILEKGQKSVNNFTGFAVALLSVVAAIWLLGKMDVATLEQGGVMISIVLGMMTGMLALLGKTCSGLKTGPIIAMIVGFGLLMAEMAILIKVLDDVSWESKVSSVVALGGILLAMAAVFKILNIQDIKAKDIWKWLGPLAVLGLIVAELALVLYAIKKMEPLNAVGNALALSTLLTAMSGVLYILSGLDMRKLSTKKMKKLALIFAGMGLILAELAFVLYSVKDMNPANALGNATALAVLLSAVGGILYVISNIKNTSNIKNVIGAMAILGAIVGEIAFVLYSIKDMNPVNAIGNATALSELLTVMTGVMAVCAALGKVVGKNPSGFWIAAGGIAALGLVVGELAAILHGIKDLDPETSVGNARALEELLTVLTGVMGACALIGLAMTKGGWVGAGGTGIAIGSLSVLGGILLELGWICDVIKNMEIAGAESDIKIVTNLMYALTGVLAACTLIGLVMTGLGWIGVAGAGIAIGSLSVLGLIILELGWVVSVIKKLDMNGAESDIKIVTDLLYELVKVLAACSIIGFIAGFSTGAILNIAALGLVILELGWVISVIKNLDMSGMDSEVKVLTNLLHNLIPVLAACTLLGIGGAFAPAGIAALAALGLIVLELGYFLSLMKDWDIGSMLPAVDVLSLLLSNLVPVLAACTILGFAAPAALSGIGALIALIGALEGVILTLGAIMSIPGFQKFLDVGIEMLEKLALGIGTVISKFAVGLTSGLPEIGQNLTDFANNIKGFLDVVNNDITDDTVTKAGKLVKVIAALMGVGMVDGFNIVDNLKKLFGGETSLESLGSKLSSFGTSIGDFITAINNFDAESATNMEAFAGAIKALNDVCANNNFGDGQLEALGKQIAGFASSMKSVAESLKDLTDDDIKNIERARDGAKAIADLNNYIPKTGGAWQAIAGTADLENWGLQIESFADSLLAYSEKVSGSNLDIEAIENSARAAMSLANLTNSLGKVGGLWQEISGQTDLVGFGEAIVPFADNLIAYNNKIVGSSIDVESIKRSADGAAALVEVANALPKEGGWWQAITGAVNLESFGSGLTYLATGLADYSVAAATIDQAAIDAIKFSGTAVDEIITVVNKIPKTGGTAGWFGEHDPYAFGSGVSALANGIKNMCTVAASITQEDIDAIGFSKSAVDKIVELVKTIPEDFSSKSSTTFKTAVLAVHDVCKNINTISTAGYDYSGIDTVKTAIANMTSMITADAANTFKTNVKTVKTAVTDVSSIASTIQLLNGRSYSGVTLLNKTLENLSKAKVQDVINTFDGKAESLKKAITGVVNALKEGLDTDTAKTSIKDAMTKLLDSGLDALKNKDKLAAAKTAGTKLASNAASGAGDKTSVTNAKTAGKNLVKGFAAGITENTYIAEAKAKAMANAAEKAAKNALDINSPSKVFRAIGYSVPEGFAQGIDRMGSLVTSSSTDMAQAAISNVKSSIARIADTINTDIDSQPTIRPVLDLSDIRSGASAIGSMLGLNSSVGVRANVGAISASMANRQNGDSSNEIVSSIKALRKDIANMPHEQYNINGITYSGDSEVGDAIKVLVRAANIERRT